MVLNYVKGTISQIGEVKSGTSQNGNTWQRTTLMLDIQGYQSSFYKIILQVSGSKVDDVLQFAEGEKVEVGYSVYAREYEGRWYNNVDLCTIKSQDEQEETETEAEPAPEPAPAPRRAVARRPASAPRPVPAPTSEDIDPENHTDDLPF